MMIKICFGRNDAFYAVGSKIVCAVEKADASHAWIEIGDYVFESVWPKSRRIHKSKHHYTPVKEFAFYLEDSKHSELLTFVYSMLGVRYSLLQLVAIAFGNAFKLLNQHLSDDIINGKCELICTELCARLLHEFYAVDFGETFDMIGINDLLNKCRLLNAVHGGYK